MKKIEAYKAIDGEIFEHSDLAMKHEKEIFSSFATEIEIPFQCWFTECNIYITKMRSKKDFDFINNYFHAEVRDLVEPKEYPCVKILTYSSSENVICFVDPGYEYSDPEELSKGLVKCSKRIDSIMRKYKEND